MNTAAPKILGEDFNLADVTNFFTTNNMAIGNDIRTLLGNIARSPEIYTKPDTDAFNHFLSKPVQSHEQVLGELTDCEKVLAIGSVYGTSNIEPLRKFLRKNDSSHPDYFEKEKECLLIKPRQELLKGHLITSIADRFKGQIQGRPIEIREGWQVVVLPH